MQYPKSKRKPSAKLSPFEHEELSELTSEERSVLFKNAIIEMGKMGILSPDQVKDYLANIDKWLIEILEN